MFKPPRKFEYLSFEEKRAFAWLTRNLHGIDWKAGTYTSMHFFQICQSIFLRNPKDRFYSKGSEKRKLVTELIERPVIYLNDRGCPKIASIKNKMFFDSFCPAEKRALGKSHWSKEIILSFKRVNNEKAIDQAEGFLGFEAM